jgi:N-acetyl-anhydromuramoyl-L-alanine amidase
MMEIDPTGWLPGALQIPSENQDERPPGQEIVLLVIHSISLPPDDYGGPSITSLFTNAIDPDLHPYFLSIAPLRVSAHVLVRRDGGLIQFVPFLQKAWHAGASSWKQRERCNDFSIGIEMEGCDSGPFSEAQYNTLTRLIGVLLSHYPIVDVVGHDAISPGRKTDPGPFFDWLHLSLLEDALKKNRENIPKVLA